MNKRIVGLAALGVWLIGSAALRADERAEAVALLDKAIQASGGAEKVARLANLVWKAKGTVSDGAEIGVGLDWTTQGIEKHRTEVEINAGGNTNRLVLVFHTDKGWIVANNRTIDAPKELLPTGREFFHVIRAVQLLTLLKEKEYALAPLGEIKVGNRPAFGIKLSRKDYRDIDVFFDKETSLPVKCLSKLPLPNGVEADLELFFSDHKGFDGLKHFGTMTMHLDGKKVFTLEVSELTPQEKLEESVFAKP